MCIICCLCRHHLQSDKKLSTFEILYLCLCPSPPLEDDTVLLLLMRN